MMTNTAETTTVRTPLELADRINAEAEEAIALLRMVRVFCHLEQRDATEGQVDGTLSDAAEGLAILMDDLADRVESIKDKTTKLAMTDRP